MGVWREFRVISATHCRITNAGVTGNPHHAYGTWLQTNLQRPCQTLQSRPSRRRNCSRCQKSDISHLKPSAGRGSVMQLTTLIFDLHPEKAAPALRHGNVETRGVTVRTWLWNLHLAYPRGDSNLLSAQPAAVLTSTERTAQGSSSTGHSATSSWTCKADLGAANFRR